MKSNRRAGKFIRFFQLSLLCFILMQFNLVTAASPMLSNGAPSSTDITPPFIYPTTSTSISSSINYSTVNVNNSNFLLGSTWVNAPYPTALYSTFNSTYAQTSADVTANRSAWFSTFNSTYAGIINNASYIVAGTPHQVQYNNNGVFAGTPYLTINNTNQYIEATKGIWWYDNNGDGASGMYIDGSGDVMKLHGDIASMELQSDLITYFGTHKFLGNIGISDTGWVEPENTLDVIKGFSDTQMYRGLYEMASFTAVGDAKFGVYSAGDYGLTAALTFGVVDTINDEELYGGFEQQYIWDTVMANSYIRYNVIGRNIDGGVDSYNADIFDIYGDGHTKTKTHSLIGGDANVTGNVNIVGNISVKRPYWNGYDNSTQNFLNTANVQVINISNNNDYDAWQIKIVNKQNLTFSSTGDYLCILSPEFYQASGTNKIITFWYQKNGVDVPWSNSRYTISNGDYFAPAIPFQFDITNPATDNIRFMWYSDSTSTQIYSSGALTSPTRPSIPGIILNCQKVSEIT